MDFVEANEFSRNRWIGFLDNLPGSRHKGRSEGQGQGQEGQRDVDIASVLLL